MPASAAKPPAAPARSTLAAMVASQARQQPAGPTLVRPGDPAAAPSAPTPTLLAPGSLSTRELWSAAQAATTRLRNSLIETSYVLWQLHTRGDWQALDLVDEAAAAEELGLGAAAYRQHLLLGERLVASGLTLEQLRSLTIDSARLLARVPADLWDEFAWVEEARMLSSKKFAALIEDRARQHAPARQRLAEPKSTLAMTLPVSQVPGVESRLGKLRQRLQVASNGEVLTKALAAVEREHQVTEKLAMLDTQLASLVALWPAGQPWSTSLAESLEERQARFVGDPAAQSLTEAAHSTAALTARLTQTLKEIHEVLS